MEAAQLKELLDSGDVEALSKKLRGDETLRRSEIVERLVAHVLELSRSDPSAARRLAGEARWLAEVVGCRRGRGLASRAEGHMLALQGAYLEALESYERAIEIFDHADHAVDEGITLTAALKPLSYLARYEEANRYAERACEIFERLGEVHRLAQLWVNRGNMEFRRDRFERALSHYRKALELLDEHGTARDVGVVLRNILVCHISVGEFDEAVESYSRAGEFCDRHDLTPLGMECDYNIAYLHFLRGEYSTAMRLYETARRLSREGDDPYHYALCDLDLAELHLELNLVGEARELAKSAYHGFDALQVGYEAAKALVFLGQAALQSARTDVALDLFARARLLFEEEENGPWLAWVDLQRAVALRALGQVETARQVVEASLDFFRSTPLATKTALCALAGADLELEIGNASGALSLCDSALEAADRSLAPAVVFDLQRARGEALAALGQREAGPAALREACSILERLRGGLPAAAHRIGFVRDRVRVYARLFAIAVESGDAAEAFRLLESAKSRHLLDLLAASPRTAADRGTRARERDRSTELNLRLNALYRLAETAELSDNSEGAERLRDLRQRIARCEKEVLETPGELPEASSRVISAGDACGLLEAGQLLLEFFESEGHYYVLVLTSSDLTVRRVAPTEAVVQVLELLRFQLSKFRLGPRYGQRFDPLMRTSTARHLSSLYRLLIEPVRDRLDAEEIIVVPHGALHYVPFHALVDLDGRPLLTDYAFSYVPSASILRSCRQRPSAVSSEALVMAVPDPRAPAIEREAAEVAAALGGARQITGEDATIENLQQLGSGRRIVHLATHGYFRRDNPMFSAIQLADRRLSLQDLHGIDLPVDLVTLSGCGTGLNVVEDGDELLGLASGFLSAGARSVLVALWDVDDRATVALMKGFYTRLQKGVGLARALQASMLAAAEGDTHLYYWGPFVLVGDSGGLVRGRPSESDRVDRVDRTGEP